MAIGSKGGRPHVTFMRMPHPSGLAIDRKRGIVHVASTRNPNQIYDLMPVTDELMRKDSKTSDRKEQPLVPIRSRFFPGCLYIHDIAFVGERLCATAVGQNAIVSLGEMGEHKPEWWPSCIEKNGSPDFSRNYIQLNSIAAASTMRKSFFSASSDEISKRRPGHLNYQVDKRGVIFSGKTREPIARGLTRPHSARLHDGTIWVDNSGYGEFGRIKDGTLDIVTRLQGWTRGLAFHGAVAFVGTSRVIPRFRQYAPGLDVENSLCGVHAIDINTGNVLGSLRWPNGNQIFSIDWLPREFSLGFPFRTRRAAARNRSLYYNFKVSESKEKADG